MKNTSTVSAEKITASENWYTLSEKKILSRFESWEFLGLSKEEVKARLVHMAQTKLKRIRALQSGRFSSTSLKIRSSTCCLSRRLSHW